MSSRVTAVRPAWAIEGGRIIIEGTGFPLDRPRLPEVHVGGVPARVVQASSTVAGRDCTKRTGRRRSADQDRRPGRRHAVCRHRRDSSRLDCIRSTTPCSMAKATSTSPTAARAASRCRSRFSRCGPNGTRETFSSGIVNATSMAIGPRRPAVRLEPFRRDGLPRQRRRHVRDVCPRTRHRVRAGVRGRAARSTSATDRARCSRSTRSGKAQPFATLPASVAAFHLAIAPDRAIWVTAPTLSTYDPIYRVAPDGSVSTLDARFGRPQGIAFDANGTLFVVEALAGASGLYRLTPGRAPELVLAGSEPHRRRVRLVRRHGRLLERDRVSAEIDSPWYLVLGAWSVRGPQSVRSPWSNATRPRLRHVFVKPINLSGSP